MKIKFFIKSKYVFVFGLVMFFSCRKSAPDFNPDLVGFWIDKDYCQDIIKIEPNGNGTYNVLGPNLECKSHNPLRASGKTKCWDNVLKIEQIKFFVLIKPTKMDTIDSLEIVTDTNLYKSIMWMQLKKRIWDGGESNTYYKLIGK